MSYHETIEIDGALIGVLIRETGEHSFHFHSGVAPYELLSGSRFARKREALEAVQRMSRAARHVQRFAKSDAGVGR